jgi:methyl-accepting chemotaxis protein
MLDYLREVARVAGRVAEGDLSENLQVRSDNDMFGRILHSMTEGLRTLIFQIRIGAEEMVSTGSGLTDLIHHNAELVEQVHTSREGVMSTMRQTGSSVEEVAHNMETLSSSVEETSAAITEMSSSVTHIAANSSELAEQAHHTIHALEQMLRALETVVENMDISKDRSQDTMQDAHQGQDAVEQVMHSMETIQETVTTAVDAITVFEQRSEEIGTILDVIRDITDQTALLALNASIIAAQAGEHGRGFAVVADEIRNLASGVGSSTKDIAEIVRSLQQDTRLVVQAIHEGASDVDLGIERTRQAQDMLQKISLSAQQSSSTVSDITETLHTLMRSSEDVSKAMAQVNMMTDEITTATTEQDASTRQIHQAIGHINDMASQIRRATAEQTDGIHHVLDEMNNVAAVIDRSLTSSQDIQRATGELSSQASVLLHSVDRFKLPGREESDSDEPFPGVHIAELNA